MAGTPGTLKKEKWETLIDEIEECGSILAACKATGIARSVVYRTRDASEEFRQLLVAAQAAGVESAEATLQRRAITGASDTALIFFLKTRKPEVYGDKIRHEERVKIEREVEERLLEQWDAEVEQLPPTARRAMSRARAGAA